MKKHRKGIPMRPRTDTEARASVKESLKTILHGDLDMIVEENLDEMMQKLALGYTLNVRVVSAAPATDEDVEDLVDPTHE